MNIVTSFRVLTSQLPELLTAYLQRGQLSSHAGTSDMDLKGNLFTFGFPFPCEFGGLIDLGNGHLLREEV